MYFVIKDGVYSGLSDRDDSEDYYIMDLPACDEWFFHANCLIIFRNFEDDRNEPQVEWVAYNLLSDNPKDERISSIGSYVNCKTGREGAVEDARREAEILTNSCECGELLKGEFCSDPLCEHADSDDLDVQIERLRRAVKADDFTPGDSFWLGDYEFQVL